MPETTTPALDAPDRKGDKTVVRSSQIQSGLAALLSKSQRRLRRLRFMREHPLQPDEWGLLFGVHLGDTYFTSALVESFRAVHGGSSVTAFVVPRQRYIPTLFDAIDRVVEVPTSDLMVDVAEFRLRKGIPFWAFQQHELINLLGYKGITLTDTHRVLLELPLDAPLAVPRRPSTGEEARAAAIFDAHGLTPGRTVVLAPDSNTVPEYPLAAWAALAEALRAAGWHPVTNGGPKGQAVPGTERIDIPLELCIAFMERAGWLVTMRTGLADVLSAARSRLTVLYPPPPPGLVGLAFEDSVITCDWYGSASLVRMGLCDHAKEYEVDEAGFAEAIPAIVAGETPLISRTF